MHRAFAQVTAAVFATLISFPASSEVIAISDAERGQSVTVAGEVSRVLDEDTFRLADDSGSIRVYIGPNRLPVRSGDRVTVSGHVDDDWGPREIYAERLIGVDGAEFVFDHRYD
jgi:uncharacterized protein YdeI (BOF family)